MVFVGLRQLTLASLLPPTVSLEMEKVLENVVNVVKLHPEGLLWKKLPDIYRGTYNEPLPLSSLGFHSPDELIASLSKDLFIERRRVFHRDHRDEEDAEKVQRIREDIVAMMTKYPLGVNVNKLAEVYNKTFHRSLSLKQLGVKSIAHLLSTFKGRLVLKGKLVFHKSHVKSKASREATATPQRAESPAESDSRRASMSEEDGDLQQVPSLRTEELHTVPLLSAPCLPVNTLPSGAKSAEKYSQDELYQRVIEVSRGLFSLLAAVRGRK